MSNRRVRRSAEDSALQRLSWSRKHVVSGYCRDGSIAFIITNPVHVNFLNSALMAALKKINEASAKKNEDET